MAADYITEYEAEEAWAEARTEVKGKSVANIEQDPEAEIETQDVEEV